MTRYDFGWRDRVADGNWLVWCRSCGCAEQHHHEDGCHGYRGQQRCLCDVFTPGKREWVGLASEKPSAA